MQKNIPSQTPQTWTLKHTVQWKTIKTKHGSKEAIGKGMKQLIASKVQINQRQNRG